MDNESIYNEVHGNKLLVNNTLEFMQQLGRYRFDELHNSNKIVIAVTGSFGKTGMKEMLKYIFSQNERVYATEGNKNNMLGVMLTGCGIDDNAGTIIISDKLVLNVIYSPWCLYSVILMPENALSPKVLNLKSPFGTNGVSFVGIKEELYNEITQLAFSYPDINFYLTGQSYAKAKELENRKIFLTKDDCIKAVKEIKNGVVIVKASRAKKFEDIVKSNFIIKLFFIPFYFTHFTIYCIFWCFIN